MGNFIARTSYTGTILGEPLALKSFNHRAQLWCKHLKEEGRPDVLRGGERVAGGPWEDVKRDWIPFSHLPTHLPSLVHFKIVPG